MSRKRQDGATPLHLAAERGHPEVIGELIDANADVNAIKSDGSTALYLASLHGQHDVVAQLLTVKNQLDLNAGTSERWTALHAACARYDALNTAPWALEFIAHAQIGCPGV